jgi:chorismate mutase / prephenate dehydratase
MTDQNSVPSLRQEIDALDANLLALLRQRAGLARQIGHGKSGPAFDPHREAEIFNRLSSLSIDDLPPESLKAIFTEIVSACRNAQQRDQVCVLGEKYGWVHDAAIAQFGSAAKATSVETSEDFLHALSQPGRTGFLPLSMLTSDYHHLLEAFLSGRLKIIAESRYVPSFALTSPDCTDVATVTDLFLTRETLTQLRHWISSLSLPVRINICRSTEEVAENLVEGKHAAGLLPVRVAGLREGHLLKTGLEPMVMGPIRCVTVSSSTQVAAGSSQPGQKTTILCALADEPGSLHRVLGTLKDHGCNLAGIEMVKFRQKPWADLFLIDFLMPTAVAADGLFKQLQTQAKDFAHLGTYPVIVG